MINKGMMSSLRQDWKTPKRFYEELDKEFDFDFDPCPVDFDVNNLYMAWGKCNFINPPYKNISKWISKGCNEWHKGKTCVFLIPSRTDTKWWHDYVMQADEIRFIKGRLRFDDSGKPAPFPSCIVIFKAKIKELRNNPLNLLEKASPKEQSVDGKQSEEKS